MPAVLPFQFSGSLPSCLRAGVARQVDEFEHRTVGVVKIGARVVHDAALAILLKGDLDTILAQMVERR